MQRIVDHPRVEDIVHSDGFSFEHGVRVGEGVEPLVHGHLGELFLSGAELVHMAVLHHSVAGACARRWAEGSFELGQLVGRGRAASYARAEPALVRVASSAEQAHDGGGKPGVNRRRRHRYRVRSGGAVLGVALAECDTQAHVLGKVHRADVRASRDYPVDVLFSQARVGDGQTGGLGQQGVG